MKTQKMKKNRFLLASVGAAVLQLSLTAVANEPTATVTTQPGVAMLNPARPVRQGQWIDQMDQASAELKSVLSTRVPHVAFDDLSVSSAMRYLADRSKEFDPAQKGFTYSFEGELAAQAETSRITTAADDATIESLIDAICAGIPQTDMRIKAKIDNNAVVIYAEKGTEIPDPAVVATVEPVAVTDTDNATEIKEEPVATDASEVVVPARPLTTEENAIIADQNDQLERAVVTRQAFETAADKAYAQGQQHYLTNKFAESVDCYQSAIVEIRKCYQGDVPPTRIQQKLNSYRQAIQQAYCMWSEQKISEATSLFSSSTVDDIDSAIIYLNEARRIYPENSARVDVLLKKAEEIKIALLHRDATRPENVITSKNASTTLEDQKYDIAINMRKGNNAYKARNYNLARTAFENVLRIDPYHREATEALRKVNEQSYKAAQRRFYGETRGAMISEVIFKQVTPLPRTVQAQREQDESIPVEKFELPIEKKLNDIIIDHLSFEDASLQDVFRFVATRSRELDPEKKGVNFVIQVRPPSESGEGGEDNAVAANAENYFTINMVIDDQPLSNVIDVICKSASRANVEVKKSVEQHAVLIYSTNVAISNLETKIWPLEGPPADMPANDANALKDYFSNQYGIQFPDGTSAIYDDQIGRLIVTNTLDRIKAIDDIVQEYKNAEPQAMIETRFVEVQQADIQELGIDWMLTRLPPDGASVHSIPFRFGTGASVIPQSSGATEWVADPSSPTGYRLLEIEQPTPTALRSLGNNGIANNYIAPGEIQDKAFWWRHTADRRTGSATNPNVPDRWGSDWTNGTDIDVAIRALSQRTTADVLATPRVTTMNGEPAMIRMVTEVYYPTEWTEPETFSMNTDRYNFSNNNDNNNNSNQVPMGVIGSTPIFGDPTQIGIRLDVTPHIDAGLELITLEMTPQILSFAGWNEYSYSLDVNNDGILDAAEEQILKMPIIETRAVTTNVTIRDAETLVLGGALREKSYAIRDKIPFLGDLPLVGRLFRNDATVANKTNLLIFLNCRIVKPDGEPHRGDTQRGLPPDR